MGRITVGKDGFPVLPGRGATSIMLMNGNARMTASKQSMATLAEMLSSQLDLPVVDMTGLAGNYDFTLYFSPEGLAGMRLPAGLPPPPPAAEGGPGMPMASAPDAQPGPNLFAAVQEQLGLKLEQRKGPVDLLVIDHLEKAPIEN
jgi:uncharacterized protein (TIGR03435 family)